MEKGPVYFMQIKGDVRRHHARLGGDRGCDYRVGVGIIVIKLLWRRASKEPLT
jgi:hypothetical protein